MLVVAGTQWLGLEDMPHPYACRNSRCGIPGLTKTLNVSRVNEPGFGFPKPKSGCHWRGPYVAQTP